MSQSFGMPVIPEERNLLAAARIQYKDGELIYHGIRTKTPILARKEHPKDDKGNDLPLEMEPAIYDYYLRLGVFGKNDPMFIRKTAS